MEKMGESVEPSDKEKFTKLLEELEWLDNDKMQMDDEMLMTPFERAKHKMLKNPLVPIGSLATAVVLGMGISNFLKGGSSRQSQIFMRWRVGLQAATIGTLVIGLLYEKHLQN